MNRIEVLYKKSPDPASFAKGYLDYLQEVLAHLDLAAIGDFVETLLQAREKDARIFFCGNGGSAATACHFANVIAAGWDNLRQPAASPD